jgi:hypothetical protein
MAMDEKIKTQALEFSPSQIFLLFFGLIGGIPLFIHTQWLTGSLVNAFLILSCLMLGFRSALLLAFVPSVVALSTGLLPFVLAPMVPFIVLGNIILIFVFYLIPKENFFMTLVLASFLKFVFLYLTAHFVAQYFLTEMILSKVLLMMSWPQFATAILGGGIAYSVLKMSHKKWQKTS